ncbi:beta-lactamase family protein [Pyrenophora tritici-repentis]|nr:beta-lactamase family protein [Pyrenophora tritici-repentis]PZD27121.1 AmpC, Beta-lactamase class C penicillin binding protein [Pyrenophora tritici-repentis]
MSPPALSSDATTALTKYINDATKPGTDNIILPAAIVHIVDEQNNVLFSHGASANKPPTAESMTIIQSLTKIVGAMAYMKLVERDLTTLDDPATITKWLPELTAKNVLTGYTMDGETGQKQYQFEDRKGEITARMLMNHTYGGGHTFFNKLLFDYVQDLGVWETTNEAVDPYGVLLVSPLLWHPGMKTNYGQGLDWLAVLIERISKQSLHDYLQEYIFNPLGLKEIGIEATYGGVATSLPHNTGKFWPRKLRNGDSFITIDVAEPEVVKRANAFPEGDYHTGCLGTGLVSSVRDYNHLLSVLLPENMGVDSVTGHRLLSAESVREITSPQLPEDIRDNSRSIPTANATPIVLPADLSSPVMDPKGSYGLGCAVQGADRVLKNGGRGRSKGSVYWYGAPNCEMWVDGKTHIVVSVWGNYYPWNDEAWVELVAGVEGRIYEALGQ